MMSDQRFGTRGSVARITARTSGLAAALLAACAALLALPGPGGTAASSKGAGSDKTASKVVGGPMVEVSVKRLGKGEVGRLHESPVSEDFVDPAPIVLWSGDHPAAVITYREEGNVLTRVGKQSFNRIEEGFSEKLFGHFPVTNRYFVKSDEKKAEDLDLFDLRQVHTGDVDGDGVDELVLVRQTGGVELHGLKKTLFKGGVSKGFHPESVHRARAGERDVLYVLFSHEEEEDEEHKPGSNAKRSDRSAVVRVDAGGITRLPLGDAVLREGKVLAVGAVNTPGSQAIDELLVLSERDGDVFLSRHRPDGQPIDPPRKVYVPISELAPIEFAFIPQSKRAVVFHGIEKRAYFIEAEKPVNWIRSVDLTKLARHPEFLQVSDGATDPKVIVLGDENELYAVNQEGTCFTWNGGFVPSAKLEPFLRIAPPSPEFEEQAPEVLIQEGGGEEILVVHSRKHQLRRPPFEEALKAAERFLAPDDFAYRRRKLEPTLDGDAPMRDGYIEDEAKKKGVKNLPKTVEEWKKLLPESYAAVVRDRRSDFIGDALWEMQHALEHYDPNDPRRARHPDELKAWLAALDLPAETTFDLYRRGARVTSFRAPGFLDRAERARLGNPLVAFHARGTSGSAVVALKPSGESTGEKAGVFVVRWGEGR